MRTSERTVTTSGTMRLGGSLLAVTAAAAALLLPPSAGAAVTIGSDLAPDPNAGVVGSNAAHTIATVSLPGGTVASPIDGVVVRWRVRADGADAGGSPVRLKVIRPAAGGAFTGVNTSATQTITDTVFPTTFTFPTQQPISAGDLIALDISAPAFSLVIQVLPEQPGLHVALWEPPLLDGQERSPNDNPFAFDWGENLYNADVEPDCDQDGFGDETQDSDTSACNPPSADVTPPETTFTRVPKNKVKTFSRRADVLFEFVSSEPGSSFGCSLDGKGFQPCGSPHVFKVKAKRRKARKHTFEVRATDPVGNVDPTPATDQFKVKRKR